MRALRRAVKTDSTGQDRKKVTKGLYFTYLGRAPTEAIYIKNCVLGDLVDVIMCAKFQNEIFRGCYFAGGRIFHFTAHRNARIAHSICPCADPPTCAPSYQGLLAPLSSPPPASLPDSFSGTVQCASNTIFIQLPI